MITIQVRDIGAVIDRDDVETRHICINVHGSVGGAYEHELDLFPRDAGDGLPDRLGQERDIAACDADADVGCCALRHHVRRCPALDPTDVQCAVAVFGTCGQRDCFQPV